jgi:hypothetical protein
MSFTVEDGTVVSGANAYETVAEFKSYWTDRNVSFSQDDAVIQAAIIIATQYVDLNNSWKGWIVIDTQSLDWPRSGVVDDERRWLANDAIPQQLKDAVSEYTSRQLASAIQPDVSTDGIITETKNKVDVIEETIKYAEGSGYFGLASYPLADNYLIGLITGGVLGGFGQVSHC